jgi:hypothetical protein
MRRYYLTIFLLFMSPASASPDQAIAGMTLATCESGTPWGEGYCVGYIRATSLWLLAVQEREGTKHVCMPEGVLPWQIQKAFIREAKYRPESLHLATGDVLWDAMVTAWPCPD